MPNSSSPIPPILEGTNALAKVNEYFDAGGTAMTGGRNAAGITGPLKFAVFGGRKDGVDGANTEVTLTASSTNYIVWKKSDAVISVSTATTNWDNTADYYRLYTVVTGTTAVTLYTEERLSAAGIFGGGGSGGSGDVVGPGSAVSGRVATFDGATGKLIQDGGVLLSDLATNAYVDGLVQGLSWKQSVRAATTTNGTLASAYESGDIIDGVTLSTDDRILLKDQSTASENGIYTVNATGAPTRSADANTGAELVSASVFVSEGATQADTQWVCTTNSPITIGSTSIGFAQLSAGGGAVSSVDASGGVETASGSAITTTGTVRGAVVVNAQTGTTYTYLTGDRGKLVTHSNASAIAATLPQATGSFPANWYMWVKNKGAGTLTITPTTSTINGAATVVLTTGQWALIASDGTNYEANVYAPSGGGSLTNFTESVDSASPNGTVPVVRLIATNAASNVDVALSPKGNGALLAAIPDGSSAGGNKRGAYAVDWQLLRSGADNVASGDYSVVHGGGFNKATNTGATVLGGESNTASGQHATASGRSSTASGNRSLAVGDAAVASNVGAVALGVTVTASGGYSFAVGNTNTAASSFSAAMGYNCRADGQGSFAMGQYADTRTTTGVRAWAGGQFAARGDAQVREGVMRISSTNATPVELTTDGDAASGAGNRIVPPSNAATYITGRIVARDNSGNAASWDFKVLAKDTGGTLSIVGQSFVSAFADAAASTWTVAASVGSPGVVFSVTGAAATSIKWVSSFESLEVVG